MSELVTIGERLLVFRKHLRQTQHLFADRMETTQAHISQIEKGVSIPSGAFVIRLIRTFPGVDLNWLFSGEGNMFREPGLVAIPSNSNMSDPMMEIARLRNEVATLEEEKKSLIAMLYRK